MLPYSASPSRMLSYEQWLFVALTCSTEVSSVPEGLISGCKEFLNSAVYSVHFVLHIVCCPEWALFLLFFQLLAFTVQSTKIPSVQCNLLCFSTLSPLWTSRRRAGGTVGSQRQSQSSGVCQRRAPRVGVEAAARGGRAPRGAWRSPVRVMIVPNAELFSF